MPPGPPQPGRRHEEVPVQTAADARPRAHQHPRALPRHPRLPARRQHHPRHVQGGEGRQLSASGRSAPRGARHAERAARNAPRGAGSGHIRQPRELTAEGDRQGRGVAAQTCGRLTCAKFTVGRISNLGTSCCASVLLEEADER